MPDRSTPIVISCQSGARSAFAAKALRGARLRARGVAGRRLLRAGSRAATRGARRACSRRAARRYSRHLLIPEVGERGSSSCSTRRCCWSAPAASARPPGCTWPRPASARSASSTPTSSTTRTCSARCCTLDRARSACRRPSRRGSARGAQPRRAGGRLPRAPHVGEHRPDPARGLSTWSSTAPTTSPRAICSTTPACATASRSCTPRSSASRAS